MKSPYNFYLISKKKKFDLMNYFDDDDDDDDFQLPASIKMSDKISIDSSADSEADDVALLPPLSPLSSSPTYYQHQEGLPKRSNIQVGEILKMLFPFLRFVFKDFTGKLL